MKIAFAGTPEFARAALCALHATGAEIALVLTQPDRPAGRGMKLSPSPVKAFALAHDLALAQPRGLRLDGKAPDEARAARETLLAARPDVMVVAAYGLILPGWALALPRLGCVNIHASLLPRWRGAAPIQRAIEAGDTRSGVTIMQMDAGLDTGDMLLVEAVAIEPGDSASTLQDKLAAVGARLVVEAMRRAAAGGLTRTPQPDEGVTYAQKIAKSEGTVDWSAPAATVERRLRAFDPFPGATSRLGVESLKLWRGRVVDGRGAPGQILGADDAGIVVACGEGALQIAELQRSGGRRMGVAQFLAAHPIAPGLRFQGPG